MEDRENELIDLFRKMDAGTRDLFLSHGRIALVAEESAKKAILRDNPLYADRGGIPQGAVLEGAVHG